MSTTEALNRIRDRATQRTADAASEYMRQAQAVAAGVNADADALEIAMDLLGLTVADFRADVLAINTVADAEAKAAAAKVEECQAAQRETAAASRVALRELVKAAVDGMDDRLLEWLINTLVPSQGNGFQDRKNELYLAWMNADSRAAQASSERTAALTLAARTRKEHPRVFAQ